MKELLSTEDGSRLYEVSKKENSERTMIVFPGGAFVNLADHEGRVVADHFSEMGYTTYLMMYSVVPNGRERMDELVEDTRQAVLKVREENPESKLYLTGFSAGGTLIANYGNRYGDVDALILCYPATDYVAFLEALNDDTLLPADSHMKRVALQSCPSLFGTDEPTVEQVKAISPINFVSEKTPASFIWHCRNDRLVPVEQNIRYFNLLREKGVSSELHIYNEGEHGAGLGTGTSMESWPGLADAFIKAL